jgi:hypothetical protein
VLDARRVERAAASDDAVDFVALFEQEFRQVRAVLAVDTGEKRRWSPAFFTGDAYLRHDADTRMVHLCCFLCDFVCVHAFFFGKPCH